MKEKTFFITLLLLCCISAISQSHEIGFTIGASNYVGDIGKTQYISPRDFSFGGIYRLNRSKRHSYRFSVSHYNIQGDDSQSTDPRRNLRNYTFKNAINEVALGIEINFWDFNLHESEPQATPYIHIGLGVIGYDRLVLENVEMKENGIESNMTIPISLGYKTRLSNKIILTFEVSGKYTFTDNLDGSTPVKNGDFNFGGEGGLLNNDWYMYSGVMLTYTFGKSPCFCNY